jgi:hypothetical protein
MNTTLRRRKERAYAVDLVLEDRLAYLQGAPLVVAWDLHGDRLLYHRWDWHYRVIKDEPEIIWDWGHVDTVLCVLDSAAGPLTDLAQGRIFAKTSTEEATPSPESGEPLPDRIVEHIAADPTNGSAVVYSHRFSVDSPYVTDVQSWDLFGSPLGLASLPQPYDDQPRWHVPHAIVYDNWVYACERVAAGPGGRVVRRAVNNLGAAVAAIGFGDLELPHSLAIHPDPEADTGGTLYVLTTTLYDPGAGSHTRSGLTVATLELDVITGYSIDFGFSTASPTEDPYAWPWDAGAGPNTGGFLLADLAGGPGHFISVGFDPGSYDPGPAPDSLATFRWHLGSDDTESLGEALPNPIFRTATGLLGAAAGILPPQELTLEE